MWLLWEGTRIRGVFDCLAALIHARRPLVNLNPTVNLVEDKVEEE